jgi:hypothetical protein
MSQFSVEEYDDLTACYWRFQEGLIEYNDTPFTGDTSEGQAEFHVVANIAEEKGDSVLVQFTPDDGESFYGLFDKSKKIE